MIVKAETTLFPSIHPSIHHPPFHLSIIHPPIPNSVLKCLVSLSTLLPHPELHIVNSSHFGSHSDITSSGKPSGSQTVVSTDDVKLSTTKRCLLQNPTAHPCVSRHRSPQVTGSSLGLLYLPPGSKQRCSAQPSANTPPCGLCCWGPVSAGCLVIALTVSSAGSDRPPAPPRLAVSALLGVPTPGGPPRAAPAPPQPGPPLSDHIQRGPSAPRGTHPLLAAHLRGRLAGGKRLSCSSLRDARCPYGTLNLTRFRSLFSLSAFEPSYPLLCWIISHVTRGSFAWLLLSFHPRSPPTAMSRRPWGVACGAGG